MAEIATQRRWFSWWRLVVAIVGLAGGLSLALVTAFVMRGTLASSTAGPAILPWLLAFGLLAPGLIIPGIIALSGPLGLFSRAAGYLALKNMRVRYLQSAAIVTPIMLASAMALSMMYQQTTLTAMTEKAYTQDIKADAVLVAQGKGILPDQANDIAKIQGVEASSPIVVSEGRFLHSDGSPEEDPFRLQGVNIATGEALFSYKVDDGSLTDLTGKSLALSRTIADKLNRRIGDQVSVRFGDGRDESLKLVATYESPDGFGSGIVPIDILISHTNSGLVSVIGVKTNLTQQQLQQSVAMAVQSQTLQVTGGDTLRQGIRNQTSVLSWVNTLFTVMVTLYALLFLINTVVIAILARRREFALQQLIGSIRSEVLKMVTLEAIGLSIIGVAMGMWYQVLRWFHLALQSTGRLLCKDRSLFCLACLVAQHCLTLP